MTRPHGVDAIAMDANVDLYTVLGLEPYPAGKSATAADIKRAYYKQARCFHPGQAVRLVICESSP